MQHMACIPQHQLQRMTPRRQLQRHLGLATAEMQMIFVRWQAKGQLISAILPLAQRRAVDQQVVMADEILLTPRWGHPHPRQAKISVSPVTTPSPRSGCLQNGLWPPGSTGSPLRLELGSIPGLPGRQTAQRQSEVSFSVLQQNTQSPIYSQRQAAPWQSWPAAVNRCKNGRAAQSSRISPIPLVCRHRQAQRYGRRAARHPARATAPMLCL